MLVGFFDVNVVVQIFSCFKIFQTSSILICLNRPFPSSCLPPLQSECEVFVMVISSTLHMNET